MRGYLKTAAMAAGEATESPLFLLDYLFRLLRVAVLVTLWRTILADKPGASPLSLPALLTYTVVAEVFAEQLTVRTTLNNSLWEGNVVTRFTRPMGLMRQLAAEMCGGWFVNFVFFSIPLLLVAPLLGVDPRPASPAAGGLFVLSLVLGILVGLALEFLFGALTVALELPVWVVDMMRVAIGTLLSGSLLPLALYPWGIGQVFAWLPFAAMAWAPLAIYDGVGDAPPLLVSQLVWVVALWPLAFAVWSANREKVVAYGG